MATWTICEGSESPTSENNWRLRLVGSLGNEVILARNNHGYDLFLFNSTFCWPADLACVVVLQEAENIIARQLQEELNEFSKSRPLGIETA